MKKIYVIVAILFATLLGSTVVKAQMSGPDCPDGSWTKPTNCWETEMTFPNNVVCSLYICYCYKVVDGVTQYFITACSFGSACANGIEDFSTILDAAALQLVKDNPPGFSCPPCPTSGNYTEVKFYPCYREVSDSVSQTSTLEPCSGTGTCTKTYSVCCIISTGVRVVNLINSSSTATCTGGSECFSMCR